jgi:TolB protein
MESDKPSTLTPNTDYAIFFNESSTAMPPVTITKTEQNGPTGRKHNDLQTKHVSNKKCLLSSQGLRSFIITVVLAVPTTTAKAANPIRLTTDGSFKQHLHWSPDGTQFLFTRIHEGKMALWIMEADGSGLKRLLPGHDNPHFDGHWSPDGKRIVYVYDRLEGTDGKLQINTCAADGSDDKVLIPHKAFEENPRWSPDGQRVLWVSTRDGNPELYTVNTAGKNLKRLTSEVAFDLHPAWSPNGQRIAFSSGRTGRQKLFVMNADGSDVKRITDGDFLDGWPAWSPDGQRIAFVSHRTGDYDIWLINGDGSGLRNLTNHPAQDTSPAWSPDGKKLAFVSTRHGGSDVYVLDVPSIND